MKYKVGLGHDGRTDGRMNERRLIFGIIRKSRTSKWARKEMESGRNFVGSAWPGLGNGSSFQMFFFYQIIFLLASKRYSFGRIFLSEFFVDEDSNS